MKNNDEKIKEILQNEEIPEQLSPKNIKLMLIEKTANKDSAEGISGKLTSAAVKTDGDASLQDEEIAEQLSPDNIKLMLIEKGAKKKISAAGIAGRLTAVAAAVAVIIGGGTNFLNYKRAAYRDPGMVIPKISRASFHSKGGSFMSGAESYDEVYQLFEKAYKNYNTQEEARDRARRNIGSGIEVDSAASAVPEYDMYETPAEADTEYTADADYYDDEYLDAEHSDTYNQEKDVLEADKVKTDGKLIYKLNKDENYDTTITVIAPDNGKMEQTAFINVTNDLDDGSDGTYDMYIESEDMYLYNDMVIVTGTAYNNNPYEFRDYDADEAHLKAAHPKGNITFTAVYSAGEVPELLNVFYQDGDFNDVRITPDGYMYVVSEYRSASIHYADPDEPATFIPCCGDDEETEYLKPEDILLPDGYVPPNAFMPYMIIQSFDLNTPGEASVSDSKALADCSGNIYCSADNMYAAFGWFDSTVTRIALSGGSITPQASAKVNGCVNDQFSMSEYNGYFRIATTGYDRSWEQTNFMTVFDMDMNRVGKLKGFGKNEQIKSVNFQGDMAYVVTFRQTDPLFAIDLSDPANPVVTDEFKINGYSSYMQKWSDGLLLGAGVDADDTGWENGVKLVMFDTSDPDNLKECGIWTLSNNDYDFRNYLYYDIYSPATSDRKAMLIDPEKNLICYPVYANAQSMYYFLSYENGGFIERGCLVNDTNYYYKRLDRAVYIGNYVYVFSDQNAISADLDTFTETDRISFSDGEHTDPPETAKNEEEYIEYVEPTTGPESDIEGTTNDEVHTTSEGYSKPTETSAVPETTSAAAEEYTTGAYTSES